MQRAYEKAEESYEARKAALQAPVSGVQLQVHVSGVYEELLPAGQHAGISCLQLSPAFLLCWPACRRNHGSLLPQAQRHHSRSVANPSEPSAHAALHWFGLLYAPCIPARVCCGPPTAALHCMDPHRVSAWLVSWTAPRRGWRPPSCTQPSWQSRPAGEGGSCGSVGVAVRDGGPALPAALLGRCCPNGLPVLLLAACPCCRKVEYAQKLDHSAERHAEHVQRVLADAAYARAQASCTQMPATQRAPENGISMQQAHLHAPPPSL